MSDKNKSLEFSKSIPLGIQHVLAMFAGNITVPIIVAGVFGQTPEQKIFLIQMALFVAGVATLIQTIGIGKIGSKLPIIQGTSFGFIPVMLPFKAFGLGAVFGAALSRRDFSNVSRLCFKTYKTHVSTLGYRHSCFNDWC